MEDFEEFDNYDEEYEQTADKEEMSQEIISILSTLSTWFIRIGMGIGIILLLYFFITAKIMNAFLFIIGLVVAFFFGYVFMFLLDKFISAN